MSVQAFSYQLRPGKFIDRGLFIELLQLLDRHSTRTTSLRDAVYIGFGGPCMEDHRALHAALGLSKMISIENDATVFLQQQFNRPLREISCIQIDAKDFVDEFDAHLRNHSISTTARKIIWFDYERADEVAGQLQSLQSLIGLANEGDVIRLTVNAQASALGNLRDGEQETSLRARRLVKLRDHLGDFVPADLSEDSTKGKTLPAAIHSAIKLAALAATSRSGKTFLPLLTVSYADGQTMLTVTGIVLEDDHVKPFLDATGIKKWPFYADGWDKIEKVSAAPFLTLRERMHLDQAVMGGRNRLPAKLDYLKSVQKVEAEGELVKLYRRYQRFFPRFQHVEM
ncbi:MAG: O-methyltransferase [Stenotrophomonas rhizophila]|uniref:O-methyltransferase n=1 Tax=Stenotrophomonas rhizophila TaxID=216778 RepID=UPI003D099E50